MRPRPLAAGSLLLALAVLPGCGGYWATRAEDEYARGLAHARAGRYGEAALAFERVEPFSKRAGRPAGLGERLDLLVGRALLERARVGDLPEEDRRKTLEAARARFLAIVRAREKRREAAPVETAWATLAMADLGLFEARLAKAALEKARRGLPDPRRAGPGGEEKAARRTYEDGVRKLAHVRSALQTAVDYAKAAAKDPGDPIVQAARERYASGVQLMAEFFARWAGLQDSGSPEEKEALARAEEYRRFLRANAEEALEAHPMSAALLLFAALGAAGVGDLPSAAARLSEAEALGLPSADLASDARDLGGYLARARDRQVLVDDFETSELWRNRAGGRPGTEDGWLRVEVPKGEAGFVERPLGKAEPGDLPLVAASLGDFPAPIRILLKGAEGPGAVILDTARDAKTRRGTFYKADLPKGLPGKAGERVLRLEWDPPAEKGSVRADILYFAGEEAAPW